MPIVYNVVRIRDGGSFTTRTVDAIQNGEVIFNMIVSFQIDEEDLNINSTCLMYQDQMICKVKENLENR